MYSKAENFFTAFIKQMVCLKFLIVYYLVFILVWSPLKILVHYLDFPLSLNFLLFFYALFFVVWASSLASDYVTQVLVSAIFHPVVVKHLRFCDTFIAGFARAFPKLTMLSIKLHISFTCLFLAHLLGIIKSPLVVELYFMTYTVRTLFVAPLMSITAIQNHELFSQLASRYFMLGADKVAAQQVSKVMGELFEKPSVRNAFTGTVLAGTLIYGAGKAHQKVAIDAIDVRNGILAREEAKTPVGSIESASTSLKKFMHEENMKSLGHEGNVKAAFPPRLAFDSAYKWLTGQQTEVEQHAASTGHVMNIHSQFQSGLTPTIPESTGQKIASALEKFVF